MKRIVIVGAGPAGIAAACAAEESGANVTVVDENPAAGGQIWRGELPAAWRARFRSNLIAQSRVIAIRPSQLTIEDGSRVSTLPFDRLILATGARERFLPFPGWTQPNVMGVGGLQALAKSGLPIGGKTIVVAGSGPLLLAVAAYFRKRGANVPLIAEQAPWRKLRAFGKQLLRHPSKLKQAFEYGFKHYRPGTWVRSIARNEIQLSKGSVHCDYLAIGYGLVPNAEAANAAGCRVDDGSVVVDHWQKTTTEAVYCAGESTGIGGVDLSIAEGLIAGYAAAGKHEEAKKHFAAREKARRFAILLNNTFALREELTHLAAPETLVCRCEDVSYGKLQEFRSWREAKLQTRCGMGPCQGRVCGPVTEFLFGWRASSVRPPITPSRVESLITPGDSK
jgi:NADPH-dependent 2,4-dienoyl-CoA reductase/sulfur reductase-like enzyme